MRLLKYFMSVTVIMVGVLFLMVLRDLIAPPREINATVQKPEGYVHGDYVLETAYNLGIDTTEVTQVQFDARYKAKPNMRPASDHLPLN